MRVLLLSPQRPETFWTMKETCKFMGKKALGPPLGLITVAALLPPSWDCRLVDVNTRPVREDEWQWADLVMISGMLVQKESLLKLTREAKERGKTVVVGGPYPTSVPQEALAAGADFLVRGEAEEIMDSLVAALEEGQPPRVFQEPGKPDMAISPVPRFDLLNLSDYVTMGIQTSRGCPFNCEFCDVVNLYGRKPRHKSPEQVIAELEAIYRLGWRSEVFICDDNFVGYQGHAQAVLEQLVPWMKEHGDPFNFLTQASVNLGQDLEMIDRLTAANFATVFVGVESSDEDILTRNRKYQNVKNPLGESLTNICANGLSLMASFMIGFDNEKKGVDERICAFAEENHLPIVVLNILQILPNTNLWDRLEKEGRLLAEHTSGDTQDLLLNYVPTRPAEEIVNEYVAAIDRLYEPSRYLDRAYHYFLTMRPTRQALKSTPKGNGNPKGSLEFRLQATLLRDIAGLLKLIWSHGVRSAYRTQFWRQAWGIRRDNPSRLIKYLLCIAMGENMFRLREQMLQSPAGVRYLAQR